MLYIQMSVYVEKMIYHNSFKPKLYSSCTLEEIISALVSSSVNTKDVVASQHIFWKI